MPLRLYVEVAHGVSVGDAEALTVADGEALADRAEDAVWLRVRVAEGERLGVVEAVPWLCVRLVGEGVKDEVGVGGDGVAERVGVALKREHECEERVAVEEAEREREREVVVVSVGLRVAVVDGLADGLSGDSVNVWVPVREWEGEDVREHEDILGVTCVGVRVGEGVRDGGWDTVKVRLREGREGVGLRVGVGEGEGVQVRGRVFERLMRGDAEGVLVRDGEREGVGRVALALGRALRVGVRDAEAVGVGLEGVRELDGETLGDRDGLRVPEHVALGLGGLAECVGLVLVDGVQVDVAEDGE